MIYTRLMVIMVITNCLPKLISSFVFMCHIYWYQWDILFSLFISRLDSVRRIQKNFYVFEMTKTPLNKHPFATHFFLLYFHFRWCSIASVQDFRLHLSCYCINQSSRRENMFFFYSCFHSQYVVLTHVIGKIHVNWVLNSIFNTSSNRRKKRKQQTSHISIICMKKILCKCYIRVSLWFWFYFKAILNQRDVYT